MKYFKNAELARFYDISEKTVRNWVIASREGKLSIELYTDKKGRQYIAETTRNDRLITELIAEGKKYRNGKTHKVVSVKEEFYKVFSREQQIDICNFLATDSELSWQYSHMGEGVDLNAEYYQRIWKEEATNSQVFSAEAIDANKRYIFDCLGSRKINVVEIGGRTGFIAQEVVKSFTAIGALNVYADVDISLDMAKYAQKNMKAWLEGLDFKVYERDINKVQITDVLFEINNVNVGNLVLFLGGTLLNFKSPLYVLQNIRTSMQSSDLFAFSAKLDSAKARRYFDFNPRPENRTLARMKEYVLTLLNIDPSYYELEQLYDKEERSRKDQIRLKFDLTIVFNFDGVEKKIDFKKGERIIIWRYWHQTLDELSAMATEAGFTVMQATQSPDEQFGMVIARPQTVRSGLGK